MTCSSLARTRVDFPRGPPLRIHTIGHSTRSLDELDEALHAHGVETLVDVRAFPGSRRHPHFSRESLAAALPPRGIGYEFLGRELGGRRPAPPKSTPHTALRVAGFRAYAAYMETPEFAAGIDRLLALAAERSVAILCAERLWWQCHRSFVADHLKAQRGVEVVHILDANRADPHRLHVTARVTEAGIVYDVGAQRSLDF